MLTAYLSTSQALEQYRCGPAGPYLDEFVEWLEKRGYRARTIRRHLLSAHRFSLWKQNADGRFQEDDEAAIGSFGVYLHQQYGLKSPSPHLAQTCIGARRFMAFLEATHRLVLPLPTSPISTEPKLLAEFRHWMWTQRGTTEATLNTYRLTLIDLIHTLQTPPRRGCHQLGVKRTVFPGPVSRAAYCFLTN